MNSGLRRIPSILESRFKGSSLKGANTNIKDARSISGNHFHDNIYGNNNNGYPKEKILNNNGNRIKSFKSIQKEVIILNNDTMKKTDNITNVLNDQKNISNKEENKDNINCNTSHKYKKRQINGIITNKNYEKEKSSYFKYRDREWYKYHNHKTNKNIKIINNIEKLKNDKEQTKIVKKRFTSETTNYKNNNNNFKRNEIKKTVSLKNHNIINNGKNNIDIYKEYKDLCNAYQILEKKYLNEKQKNYNLSKNYCHLNPKVSNNIATHLIIDDKSNSKKQRKYEYRQIKEGTKYIINKNNNQENLNGTKITKPPTETINKFSSIIRKNNISGNKISPNLKKGSIAKDQQNKIMNSLASNNEKEPKIGKNIVIEKGKIKSLKEKNNYEKRNLSKYKNKYNINNKNKINNINIILIENGQKIAEDHIKIPQEKKNKINPVTIINNKIKHDNYKDKKLSSNVKNGIMQNNKVKENEEKNEEDFVLLSKDDDNKILTSNKNNINNYSDDNKFKDIKSDNEIHIINANKLKYNIDNNENKIIINDNYRNFIESQIHINNNDNKDKFVEEKKFDNQSKILNKDNKVFDNENKEKFEKKIINDNEELIIDNKSKVEEKEVNNIENEGLIIENKVNNNEKESIIEENKINDKEKEDLIKNNENINENNNFNKKINENKNSIENNNKNEKINENNNSVENDIIDEEVNAKEKERLKEIENESNTAEEEMEIKQKNQKIHKKYRFANIGNNCYLNSSLQLLTRISDLTKNVFDFDINQIKEDNATNGQLIKAFKNILTQIEEAIDDDRLIINPRTFKETMGKIDGRYLKINQEDSNEFISNFIDALLWETADKEKYRCITLGNCRQGKIRKNQKIESNKRNG